MRSERAVLVFLEDSDMLKRYERFVKPSLGTIFKLDPLDVSSTRAQKDEIIAKRSGEPKAVTIATAAYGRGEDFKYSPAVLEKGGGHAIQLFLSLNKADEVQIRGRVARKNEPGSFSLILNWENLDTVLTTSKMVKLKGVNNDPVLLYQEIDKSRMEASSSAFDKQRRTAVEKKKPHKEIFDLLQRVRQYYMQKLSRPELLTMIDNMNTSMTMSVDLCFIMDCTGSMGSYISEAKEQLFKVIKNARDKFSVSLRIAYIAYRDHDYREDLQMQVCDFCGEDTKDKVIAFINQKGLDLCSTGGPDYAEDVVGGIEAATKLSWQSDTRLTVHIGDAPGHGNAWHAPGLDDNYPGGDPKGRDLCDMLKKLMSSCNSHYFFFKITNHTDVVSFRIPIAQ